MADDKEKGLYNKYNVTRTDGKPVGECIVLEMDDPYTWLAIRVFADRMKACGYNKLYKDLTAKLNKRTAEIPHQKHVGHIKKAKEWQTPKDVE